MRSTKKASLYTVIRSSAAGAILWYLKVLAKTAIVIFRPKIIGVAGSVGKSSTRNAVATVLASSFPIRVIETNSETGLPLGILGIKPHDYSPADWISMLLRAPFGVGYIRGAKYLVIEMGIDDPYPPKNMEYLLSIVSPDIGIITYESAAHTQQFSRAVERTSFATDQLHQKALIEAITREDFRLITNPSCRVGIINADIGMLMRLAEVAKKSGKKIYTFGSQSDADIRASEFHVTPGGTTMTFVLDRKHGISLSFPKYAFPKEYKGTFAAALLAAREAGIDLTTAKNALEKGYHPPPGRAGIFAGIKNTLILDSSYNASKPTDLAFLTLLGEFKKQTKRPAVAILADMLELGPQEKLEHEEVAGAIPKSADYVYLVGPITQKYILPVLEKSKEIKEVRWFESADALNSYVTKNIPDGALVLVKGSQGKLWLEETIKLLLLNKSDVQYLCRQNAFWQKVKKKAGRWVDVSSP